MIFISQICFKELDDFWAETIRESGGESKAEPDLVQWQDLEVHIWGWGRMT